MAGVTVASDLRINTESSALVGQVLLDLSTAVLNAADNYFYPTMSVQFMD